MPTSASPVTHRPADGGAERRVVDRLGRVGAQIADAVPGLGQHSQEVLLQLESGVIRADGDERHGGGS